MIDKLILAAGAMLVVVGSVAADEIDAVINDPARAFTKRQKSPEKFFYGKLTLDSKGQVVSMSYKEGLVAKQTKVALGVYDEKKKKWKPGEAIEGGVEADVFNEAGKVVRVRVALDKDGKTISQILVTNADEQLVMADSQFDAVLKEIGSQTNGNGGIAYTRLDLDEQGKVVKTFPLKTGRVTSDTKVVMGKYDEQAKKWEAGEAIPNGLYGDIFKDLGAKTVYVRMTFRDDHKAISQILVRQIGETDKK